MDEREWLAGADPKAMLEHLDRVFRSPTAWARKTRLFAAGCCRQVWHILDDERSRRAVEVAEWYADGGSGDTRQCPWFPDAVLTDLGYLQKAHREAQVFPQPLWPVCACAEDIDTGVRTILASPIRQRGKAIPDQAALLRCVFGNPFRQAVSLERRNDFGEPHLMANGSGWLYSHHPWIVWDNGTAPRLAAAIYEGRTFDRCPILADALEDAGCNDVGILGHLRGGGPHVRGCFALDLVLGRE